MEQIARIRLAGREHLKVRVAAEAGPSGEAATRNALARAIARIKTEGFDPRHIVRSRLFARDRAARTVAGDIRLDMLNGPLRGASSSYIDPDRLPPGSDMAIDLLVLRAKSGAEKRVREYDPVVAPPMFVTLDGMAYLSGMTDTSDGFDAQHQRIRASIAQGLDEAGSGPGGVTRVTAFLARSEPFERAWADITAGFPGYAGPLSLSPVEGFTTPEKRLEIETTAVIG